jgi:ribose transport system substrate-binding protein
MTRHAIWLAAATTILLGPLPGQAQQQQQTLAVFTKSLGNPVAKGTRSGVDNVAKANNLKVFHYIPTSPDNAAQQTGLVDEALKQKPDAVLFTPVDIKAMVPAAAKITAASIPLIGVGDRLAGAPVTAFVGTDDQGIALATAQKLFQAMGGKGNVVVLEGPPNIPTAPARLEGFKTALKEFPDIKVILSKNANYARPSASDLIKSMLRLNPPPQIDGVLAANDAMAFGALEALKAANKKALIVGINGSKEAVDFIKSGDMLASGDYSGQPEGCVAAEIALRILRKEEAPKEIIVKSVVVDKSNYQDFETPIDRRPCPTIESVAGK